MYPYPSRARPTWATCATTPSATCIVRYRTMNGYGVLSPDRASTASACRPRTPPSRPASTPARSPTPASRSCVELDHAHRRGRTTGAARSRATTPRTSAGPSGSSCGSSRPAWPTAPTAPVNWCPGCQTVLANEQVLADGTCERSGDLVEQARPRAVVLQDHRLRPAAARRPRRPRLARAGQDHAAQLDRPVRGRRVRPAGRRRRATDDLTLRVFTTRPDTSFGMTYVVLAPEHPLVADDHHRRAAGPRSRRSSTRPGARAEIDRLSSEGAARRSAASSPAPTPSTRSPASRCPIYLADYVLVRPTAPGRSWPCPARTSATGTSPRPTTCRSSAPSQPPDGLGRRGVHRRRARPSTASGSTACGKAEAKAKAIEWLEAQGIGERKVNYRLRDWLLSPPAVLGLPDPDRLLPRPRRRAGARRRAAGAGPRRRRVPARPASRRCKLPRGLPAHDLPDLRRPGACARPTPWTPSSTRPGTSCASRPVERRRAVRPGRGGRLDAGRPVHRRGRARHPPPDVRPVLHQGAGRPRRRARRSCASRSPGCSPRA